MAGGVDMVDAEKMTWIDTYNGKIRRVLYVGVILLIINSFVETFENWGNHDYYKIFSISTFPNLCMLLIMFVPRTVSKYIGFSIHKVLSIIWVVWGVLSLIYLFLNPEDQQSEELLIWEIPDKIMGCCFLLCIWITNDVKTFRDTSNF